MNKQRIFLFAVMNIALDIRISEAHPLKLKMVETSSLNLGDTATTLLSILGRATYYDVAAGIGSCGQLNSGDDMVVAVSSLQMQNGINPNNNPLCNKEVTIIGRTGHPAKARIVDTCPGCSSGCLDMSSALFKLVCGDLSLGVCEIKWTMD